MRPSKIRVTGAGVSPWFPVDYMQPTLKIGTSAFISSGATVSYGLDVAYELPSDDWKQMEYSRATTTLSVTFVGANHGLSIGDTFVLRGTAARDGAYTVAAVTSATVVTATVADAGDAAGFGFVGGMRVVNVYTTKVADFVQNIEFPIRALRLNVASSDGFVELVVLQGQNR